MEIKVGDIVILKSGSPEFTITGWDDKRVDICAWVEGTFVCGTFFPDALKKV